MTIYQDAISYKEIRDKKLVEYGTEFKDWIWILVKQYKDRTHFLFELLQNAEDAKASQVHLFLKKDRLVIEHNGILFSKDDVVSITKVAKSTKSSGEGGSIGRFGIGFKSVYAYASTPRIYSGNYSFEIRDFIYPHEIPAIDLAPDWTRIEIPFNNGEINPQKAFAEIQKALNDQIRSDTLLFLNNIEELQIFVEGASSPISISKVDRERPGTGGSVLDVNIRYTRGHRDTEDDYLLFTDCEEEAVCIAFKVADNELVPVPNTSIFTYFPTDKESHQAFYIHAPFDTTPARDNIVEDSDRNKHFIQNICAGINMAFCWMRDNGYLSLSGLNATYPIYQYSEDTIFYSIYQAAIRIIGAGEKLIPTNRKGVFKSRSEIMMADNQSMVDIFPDEDIQSLFTSHKIFWIAKEITKDSCQPLREFLKKNFQFKTYTWRDLILRLNSTFLQQKDLKWFEKLFTAIRSFSVTGTKNLGSHDIDVTSIPFVRLQDKTHITAFQDGHFVVYINNPSVSPLKIDSEFLKNETIKRFYRDNLHIPEYNIVTIVTEQILPKYAERGRIAVSTKDLRENISDLKMIKDAVITSPLITEKVSESFIVTDGKEWYIPSELHIPSGYGSVKQEYSLLKDIYPLKFFSLNYQQDPKLDEKFFLSIGCPGTLRQTKIEQKDYLNLVKKYMGNAQATEIRQKIFNKAYRQGVEWDICYEGLQEVFSHMDEKRSRRLASFLNKNVRSFAIRGDIHGAQDQQFQGAHVDSMNIYTGLGLLLSFVPWIYTKDGVKKSVQDIHRADVDSIYEKEAKHLLDILPFIKENSAIEVLLSSIKDESKREMLRELLTNQESLDQVTKAWKTMKLKEVKAKNKAKKNPQEVLAEMAGKKGKGAADPQDDEAESITNPERRKKKLEQEFSESMGFVIAVPKTSLRYTFQDRVSKEEKAFLDIQYNGYCQICGTTILKYNGGHHFQAINVMKTSDLEDKYKNALDTGWNSLCLCPNCAAKYRYGIKDVSSFYDQVQTQDVESGSDEYINIDISLQDQDEKIHYTPKHFLALKTAMEVFSK